MLGSHERILFVPGLSLEPMRFLKLCLMLLNELESPDGHWGL